MIIKHNYFKQHISVGGTNDNDKERGELMRLIFKILLFPISLILSVISFFLTFLLGVGTWLLNIVSGLIIFGALASFINGEVGIGISAIVLAFIFSPLGLPYLGTYIVAGIERLNLAIKNL